MFLCRSFSFLLCDIGAFSATSLSGVESVKLIGFTNGEWISITPEGYYNASPNGDHYLNVKIGDKVYGINQYREIFYKPNAVSARLSGRDATQLGFTANIQNVRKVPTIEILSETLNEAMDSVILLIRINDENDVIRKIEFYANGSQLGDDVLSILDDSGNLKLESSSISVSGDRREHVFRIPIPLTDETTRIQINAFNSSGGKGEKETIVYGKAQEGLPNLWILAIGINNYFPGEKQSVFHSLRYAVNDALAFVDSIKSQVGKLYKSINLRVISDDSILPTKENIENNLNFLKNAGSNDIAMLFISCHGLNDEDNNFYFIPRDFQSNLSGSVHVPDFKTAVSSNEIKEILSVARSTKMVFIDACHSGNVEGANIVVNNSQLISDLSNKESIIILTSSNGSEQSQELPLYGHGAFTYSLLEGMSGKAAPDEKEISLEEIIVYVKRNVKRLVTKSPQTPQSRYPVGFDGNLIMAILD